MAEKQVSIGKNVYTVADHPSGYLVVDGATVKVDAVFTGPDTLSLILDGKVYSVSTESNSSVNNDKTPVIESGKPFTMNVNGVHFEVTVDDHRSRLLRSLRTAVAAKTGPIIVRAPMPGLVSKVEVSVGEKVSKGQGLIILEAMKMENEICSPEHASIKEISVQSGRPVEKGETLLVLEQAVEVESGISKDGIKNT